MRGVSVQKKKWWVVSGPNSIKFGPFNDYEEACRVREIFVERGWIRSVGPVPGKFRNIKPTIIPISRPVREAYVYIEKGRLSEGGFVKLPPGAPAWQPGDPRPVGRKTKVAIPQN